MLCFLSILWDINPDALVLGPFRIKYYGLFFILAFSLGTYIFDKIIKLEKLPTNITIRLLNIVFLSTFIGARLGDCLFYYPQYYLKHPWQILFPFKDGMFTGFQGLSSHGAAIGLLIGLYLFARLAKLSYTWLLDRIVIVIALAGVFIRLGNLMNSEIYGTVTNLPWGFIFSQNGETVPRHPTQIYEAIAYLSIFLLLGYYYIKKQTKLLSGILFGLFLILTFTSRFLIEYLKAPHAERESNLALNIGQTLSLPFIFLGAIILMITVMRSDVKKQKDVIID